jgi:hypothetical protein
MNETPKKMRWGTGLHFFDVEELPAEDALVTTCSAFFDEPNEPGCQPQVFMPNSG